jgi:hypothetical protein
MSQTAIRPFHFPPFHVRQLSLPSNYRLLTLCFTLTVCVCMGKNVRERRESLISLTLPLEIVFETRETMGRRHTQPVAWKGAAVAAASASEISGVPCDSLVSLSLTRHGMACMCVNLSSSRFAGYNRICEEGELELQVPPLAPDAAGFRCIYDKSFSPSAEVFATAVGQQRKTLPLS